MAAGLLFFTHTSTHTHTHFIFACHSYFILPFSFPWHNAEMDKSVCDGKRECVGVCLWAYLSRVSNNGSLKHTTESLDRGGEEGETRVEEKWGEDRGEGLKWNAKAPWKKMRENKRASALSTYSTEDSLVVAATPAFSSISPYVLCLSNQEPINGLIIAPIPSLRLLTQQAQSPDSPADENPKHCPPLSNLSSRLDSSKSSRSSQLKPSTERSETF